MILPYFVKKARLLILTLSQLGCLILLFGVLCAVTKADWFILVSLIVIFSYISVFYPIFISIYNVPALMKKHNAVISLAVIFVCLSIILLTIQVYTSGKWFISFALPLLAVGTGMAGIIIALIRYTKLCKLLKAGIILLLFIPFSILTYILTESLLESSLGVIVDKITLPDFSVWTGSMIASNVLTIVFGCMLICSLIFIILGILNTFSKKQNPEPKDK